MRDLKKQAEKGAFSVEVQGVRNLNLISKKSRVGFLNRENICPKKMEFVRLVFFHADLGVFFVGPMFFSFGFKWDVYVFLPFLGVISPWGKERTAPKKNESSTLDTF